MLDQELNLSKYISFYMKTNMFILQICGPVFVKDMFGIESQIHTIDNKQ